MHMYLQLIAVGAEPEQAILCDQGAAEFDSPDGLGRALCLGEMGQDRIGEMLLRLKEKWFNGGQLKGESS